MAKVTQEISLDIIDTAGGSVCMIISTEEARELYNELVKVLNISTGFSYPDDVRSPYDQRIWNPCPQCENEG